MASSSKRFLKLATMTASIASKTVSNTIRNITSNETEKTSAKQQLFHDIGVQIANTLGEMKGAVMKVGQIASQYKDIFPPEVSKAIEKLQRQAPAMPFDQIKPYIEKELAQPLHTIFASFDETPFAAASIGQVHRAKLHSGEDVVVKVQYPGVDEACESDLKQVRLALRLMGVLKIDKKLQDQLFNEIQESLSNELNYEIEAQNLEVARSFHANLDTKIIIPSIYKHLSTRHILTLSYEPGESIQTASSWPQPLRNELGKRLFRAMGQEIFYLRRFHCDPHPGNFSFRENGEVVVYDYGGVKIVSPEIIQHFKQLISAARNNDLNALEDHMVALRALTEKNAFPPALYEQWLDVLLRPLTKDYDFAENSAHHDGVKLAKQSLKYWDLFRPSPDTLMINRTVSGHYWNLIHLKVHDNLNDLFEELIPPTDR
ncbi:AarF/ABC1/UbiB kinase family protein [Acinetobacter sp. B5B]|uniref:ABC1 kinase family protein n=1 Tax=Acinetobacter baretiae TaxID=2605383 RepID=UPI0018C2CBB8|nr:AarF/ABC1/UbiB kinase family protein [Acinetobacter baretiae]MBF7682293.1 AarF/ABC1/UbiB kinase family protein [Acinetobacter baretiae]MBF7685121.1 AarF/ABC1/UbiB kinase family protein [Acinetobacter baretiae]